MLIGQFGESYPPAVDGVGRVMFSYCQHLQAIGHRALYIAPNNRQYPKPTDYETILYGGVHIPGEAYRVGFPRMSADYRRATTNVRFDILHAHSPFVSAREARRLARRDGAPLVATFHSKYYDDFLKVTHSTILTKAVVQYIVNFYHTCDEVWTVSRQAAEVLTSYGYLGDIVVMHNGTDPFTLSDEQRQDALLRYPVQDAVPILIFVGQQNLKKNPDALLRACKILKDTGQKFQLIMVGSGPDMGKLQALMRELKIEHEVLFTGFMNDRNTLMALYERADLMVFPSLYDTFSLVVREAAVMGTPSLLIEGSCAAQGIIHEQNGYVCQNSPQAIAQAVVQALPTAKTVGIEAQKTIPIPWSQLILEVEARYIALIQAKQRGSKHET